MVFGYIILQNCAYFKWKKFLVLKNENLPDFIKMALNRNGVREIIKSNLTCVKKVKSE